MVAYNSLEQKKTNPHLLFKLPSLLASGGNSSSATNKQEHVSILSLPKSTTKTHDFIELVSCFLLQARRKKLSLYLSGRKRLAALSSACPKKQHASVWHLLAADWYSASTSPAGADSQAFKDSQVQPPAVS